MVENDTAGSQKWKIGEPRHSFKKWFKNHPNHASYIPDFEDDVIKDPYRNPGKKRIKPVQREDTYPPGCYRWRKSDLRIVYLPCKSDHTVYPLDAHSAAGIRYK